MEQDEPGNIPFNIEIGCQLFIQTNTLNERIPTFLVGVIPQSGLIIKTPYIQGLECGLVSGDQIVIRYVFMGEVFGFKSKVMTSIAFPFKLTFISYPEKIEKLSLRKKTRIICNIPSQLLYRELEIKGVVADMSSDGVLFVAKTTDNENHMHLSINAEVALMIPLMGVDGKTRIDGVIKNFRINDRLLKIGIRFKNLSHEIEQKLEKYVNAIMTHC